MKRVPVASPTDLLKALCVAHGLPDDAVALTYSDPTDAGTVERKVRRLLPAVLLRHGYACAEIRAMLAEFNDDRIPLRVRRDASRLDLGIASVDWRRRYPWRPPQTWRPGMYRRRTR